MSEIKKDPIPQGNYVPAVRSGNMIYSAGMTCRKDGKLIKAGKIGANDDLGEYREAFRCAAENAIIAIENRLSDGEQIRPLTMTVMVSCCPEFTAQPKLADFASEYLCERFGENGRVARMAVGVATLPGDSPCEIQITAEVVK